MSTRTIVFVNHEKFQISLLLFEVIVIVEKIADPEMSRALSKKIIWLNEDLLFEMFQISHHNQRFMAGKNTYMKCLHGFSDFMPRSFLTKMTRNYPKSCDKGRVSCSVK